MRVRQPLPLPGPNDVNDLRRVLDEYRKKIDRLEAAGPSSSAATQQVSGSSSETVVETVVVKPGPSGPGFANPMTTKGDLIYGETGGTPTRLPVGSEGQVLILTDGTPTWVTVDITGWGS